MNIEQQRYKVKSTTGVSAVLITLNAERYLEQILGKIHKLCDEIVVVDCGSTDRTAEICSRYNVKFIFQEWLGYGPQKNKAHEWAKGPYILSLDADEIPDDRLIDALKNEFDKGLQGAYRINRLPFWCGRPVRHSGWYPDWKIRLFPKDSARWSEDPVHEVLILTSDLPIRDLNGFLHHYSYHSIKEHKAKTRRYANLAAQKLQQLSRITLITSMLFKPLYKFIRHYFYKIGFMDGWAGFYIAQITAWGTYLKFKKALHLKEGR